MKGITTALVWSWKGVIDHNDRNEPHKIIRYRTGRQRFQFLKNNAQAFAVGQKDGEEHCAYLVELDADDLDSNMPDTTRYEYFCGKRLQNNEFQIFAYIWFDNLDAVKSYVKSHGMTILGGWS